MSARCFLRRIAAFAALGGLIAAIPIQARSQQAQAVSGSEVVRLLNAGRNVDAAQLAKRFAETAPLPERQSAFRLAAQTCVTAMDVDCARDVLNTAAPYLQSLPASELQQPSLGYVVLLKSFFQVMTGDYQATFSGPGFPNPLASAISNPVLIADLYLLAAKQSRLVFDFEASRDNLDKALTTTLSLDYERSDAPRLIIRIAAQLLENYEVERAVRLVAAASPILQTIPPDSLLGYEFLQVFNTLAGYRKDFDGLSQGLHVALSRLDQLQLKPALNSYLKSAAYNDLLGAEVLRGDHDAARKLLQSHPLMAAKPAILKRGYFVDANEFNFALVEEFTRLVLKDATETGWGDLMKMSPGWTTDPERIQEVQAFGQAAVGFQLLRAGKKDEARLEFIEAGKKRLSTLQGRYRKSVYASPLPYWTDQVLLEFALAANLSDATPDYELVLQAHVVLNRSMENSPDDALTSQAIQPTDERKRIAQSLHTIQYQQVDWERAQLVDLAKRLSSPNSRNSDEVAKVRLRIFSVGKDFIQQQHRLRAALADGSGSEGVDSVADLATVKSSLLADEALIFHVPAFGLLGKICVRADRVWSSTQQVDTAAIATDARLLRAALTATHPASTEADSQFPAVEAVRLGKLLFGGLDECLRASKRVYVVATTDVVGQVPPAALLAEVPPALGSGFDLRAAHWMIRDHSFVRTTSINAFVATKRLSRTRRATLDYLGVGDPVLAQRNAAAPAGGQLVARGSLPVQSGALATLPELPETSEELERVAKQFGASKARILRRDGASEEAFRLQPLSEFDVIHFATHGLVREEPQGLREPSLVLTPNPDGDPLDDGLLTSSQIAALPLRARLVVLSACNSARYQPSIIDSGIQGLSTSFAIAGVPSMIASLWPIESALTRDLIIATFQAAHDGEVAIADALAIAVRKHLDGPAPRPLLHPRFWAALVVLGDGSMALNSPVAGAPRDLGPFAPVDDADGDEFLSAAIFGGDFITSAIGNWNGTRSPSLIRRRTADGTTKWEVKDGEIGAGPTAAGQEIVYSGGYRSFPNGALVRSVPVLRALSPDGEVLWSRRLASGPNSTFVMGLAAAMDQSAFALVGPHGGEESGAVFTLARIDKSGTEVATLPLAIAGDTRSYLWGHFAVSKDAALATISRGVLRTTVAQGFDWLGLSLHCFEGDAAEIFLVDLSRLKEQRRLRIDRFHAHSALALGDGWVLVGDARDDCGLDTHAAAYRVNADGSIVPLWRDAAPFDTFARAVRSIDGVIEIVGFTKRSVAVREEITRFPKLDFSRKRWGEEPYISGEIFSVRFSERGVEERRDFVAAGFPLVPLGMVSTKDRSAIFGTVTSRALWMAH
ncbi:MAG TPA: CHAT domain-containing protein [Reyranella sp.]